MAPREADKVAEIARRIRGLYDNPRKPEHFHEEKDGIYRDLMQIAGRGR